MSAVIFDSFEDESGDVVGVKITVENDDTKRTVEIAADDSGNLHIGGVGPNGEKRGKADPEGNGDNPLGK